MDDFKPFIAKVATGASLSREEARDAFDTILSGEVTNAQAAAFLMALRVRGETVEEIAGAVSTSAAPEREDAARLPCLATGTPQAAVMIEARVETL